MNHSIPRTKEDALLVAGDPFNIPDYPQCDRCGEKTDAVYPMARTYFGDWFEIKSNHSARIPDGYYCYGCCDDLEGGAK
jgi:hypothetical protein